MNRSARSRIAAVLLAFGGLAAAAAAHARTDVHVSINMHGQAPVHVPVQPVHLPAPRAGYVTEYRHQGVHARCGALRWHPHVRYMPGEVVRRHGDLWMARRISARVWNENSPPEWTPQYWAPAVCG
jgi:hypothetical protein